MNNTLILIEIVVLVVDIKKVLCLIVKKGLKLCLNKKNIKSSYLLIYMVFH